MLKLTWKSWLGVWLCIQIAAAGLYFLLVGQGVGAGAYWVAFAGGILTSVWTGVGLYHWREVSWVKRFNTLVITTLAFGTVMLLFRAVDWQPGLQTAAYLYLAVLGFLLGINVLRVALRAGHPILGVARTMLEEALRMGIALIFIVALLVLLVALPLVLGSEDRVTYMVQRFLTYSTGIVGVLLGLMTVLLAARSVSLEIASRQVQMTLTKPLSRYQYLLGKWLGIVLLNAVLLAVSGVAIYGFTMAIAKNPALNDFDRYAVDREVLTARLARTPDPIDATWQDMYENVLAEKQGRDPEKFGEVGDPFSALSMMAQQEVIADTVSRFYTVDGGQSQDYKFSGLEDAAAAAERAIQSGVKLLREESGLTIKQAEAYVNTVVRRPTEDLTQEAIDKVSTETYDRMLRVLEREVIQLELTPKISPGPENDLVELTMRINNQPWPRPAAPGAPTPRQTMVTDTTNEVAIPASLIAKDGTLVVTIEVPETKMDGFKQAYLQFNPKDAQPELYYRVGSFEGNLTRAMLVTWLKLSFLAMVGIVVGSLLSFPVAAMFGIVVFVAAAFSGVIDESLDAYASVGKGAGTWDVVAGTFAKFTQKLGEGDAYAAFKILIRLFGEGFMLLMPSFGSFATTEPLSTGVVIGWDMLTGAALKIGLIWTGAVGLIGVYLFSRKELAKVVA